MSYKVGDEIYFNNGDLLRVSAIGNDENDSFVMNGELLELSKMYVQGEIDEHNAYVYSGDEFQDLGQLQEQFAQGAAQDPDAPDNDPVIYPDPTTNPTITTGPTAPVPPAPQQDHTIAYAVVFLVLLTYIN